MAGFPRYSLYAANGVTLVYLFEFTIDDAAGSPFLDPVGFVEHTSLRGQGSIISEGSLQPFDITLTFILQATGSTTADKYENLVAQMEDLLDTIEFNTPYILKVELTEGGSTRDIKVKRLSPFIFPLDRKKKRVTLQTVQVSLRALSWA